MKKENRTYRMYLVDIQTSMARIAEYIEGFTFIDFKRDYKTVDAVIRNFEVIGEASKNLPAELKEKYPKFLGVKCIYSVIKSPMNILVLIMKLSGMLLQITFLRIKFKLTRF